MAVQRVPIVYVLKDGQRVRSWSALLPSSEQLDLYGQALGDFDNNITFDGF